MSKRPPIIRVTHSSSFDGELVVDNFAGGGGASTGISKAIGRPVDIAINHSPEAIAVHKANHPETKHFCENIWEVDPRAACGSRPVGLAWFSPDCTHFSRAKGTKPLKQEIRGLAWVVVRWAKAVRPRVIVLENVEEFQTWGPLDEDGRPRATDVGRTFREWLGALKGLGYEVEFRTLVAADYGTPTIRKRLFLVARRDRGPLAFPEPTHGKGRRESWRPAADVIDWSLPCPSIFDRARPLAPATLRRIAVGIQRYVLDAAQPFILPVKSWGWGGNDPRSIEEPMRTVTASKRGEFALCAPSLMHVTHQGGDRVAPIDEPMRTVTGAHRGEIALVSPTLIQTGYGEREGQSPRVPGLDKPLGTVVAGGAHAVVAAFLAKHFGGVAGHGLERPIGTVTGKDHHSLVTASLVVKNNYGDKPCTSMGEPLHTVTTQGNRFAHVAAFLTKFFGTSVGSGLDQPLPTVLAGGGKGGGHLAEVQAFLVQYNGQSGPHQLGVPLGTVTSRDRFGLVTIAGEDYQIVDIGMRMLQPHELFAAQGFPGDYEIAPEFNGKPLTKTQQIKLAGNSVCPQVAEAIVVANARRAA